MKNHINYNDPIYYKKINYEFDLLYRNLKKMYTTYPKDNFHNNNYEKYKRYIDQRLHSNRQNYFTRVQAENIRVLERIQEIDDRKKNTFEAVTSKHWNLHKDLSKRREINKRARILAVY